LIERDIVIQNKEKCVLELQKQLTRPPPTTTTEQLSQTKREMQNNNRRLKAMESEIKMLLSQKTKYEEQICTLKNDLRQAQVTLGSAKKKGEACS